MKPSFSRKPAAVLFSVLALASSGVFAAESTAATHPADSTVIEATGNPGWDNSNMQQIAVHTGREVVHHLAAAQEALAKGESGKALGEVTAANRLNDSVMQSMPYVNVKEDVFNAKGKLALEDTDRFYDDLLPIYAELDDMQVYAPQAAQKARGKIKEAESMSRKGQSKEASDKLKEVMDDFSSTELLLPVGYVHGQLEAAQNALDETHRDVATAKTAIDNALQSITAVTDSLVLEPKPAS